MFKSLLISLIAMSSLLNVANAGIIVGNPISSFSELDALPESDTDIHLYAEVQNLTLGSALDVDFLAATGIGGIINAGTKVDSFIFNFDAVGNGTDLSFHAEGRHFFDTEILAVIWTGARPSAQIQTDNNLEKSDSVLGAPGGLYPTGEAANGRGLELEAIYDRNGTVDTFFVTGNQIDLSLFVKAAYADQLRVITAAKIPEPTAFLLFGTALCLFGLRRFNKS